MTRAEYVALHGVEPHDDVYWSRFGTPSRCRTDLWPSRGESARGLQYRDHGVELSAPGQRRSFGGGRKERGYASGDPRA